MILLFVSRMLRFSRTPLVVMYNSDNDVRRVLAPFLAMTSQLSLWLVEPIVINTPRTMPWYRLTHTKLHAWSLPCEAATLVDYDGIPLRSLDTVFDDCHAALATHPTTPPICGVSDRLTPFSGAKRSGYLNAGLIVVQPNRSVHEWLLWEAKQDSKRPTARYFAEQGFFHERGLGWARLPDGYNVQRRVVPASWRPRTSEPMDYFLHVSFIRLPGQVQNRLAVSNCSSTVQLRGALDAPTDLRVGPCYLSWRRKHDKSVDAVKITSHSVGR